MTQEGSLFIKYQRNITIIAFMCYQLCMVPLAILSTYALITWNMNIIIPLIVVCVVQYPIKKSKTFIQLVKKYIDPTNYFNKFTRIIQQKIAKDEKTFYGFHPHSIFSISILLNMNRTDDQLPDFVGLGSRFGFNAPFLGMFLRLWGCSTVDCQNLKRLMQQGKSVGLVPGGYEQASLTTLNEFRLYLKKRKGFIKYALRYGYTLRPVLCFGEHKAFQTLDVLNPLKLFLNRFKVPIAFFMNRKYGFFINPDIQITTVIGKGIKRQYPQNGYYQPTIQQIDKYHQLYIDEITRIYNKYKSLNDGKPLVIY